MVKKVYIDAGHGGTDYGIAGINKVKESIIVMDIANRIKSLLINDGYDVKMSREDNNTSVSLSERSSDCNEWGADIVLSIHCNACDGTEKGLETYIYDNTSFDLASNIHGSIMSTGLYYENKGVIYKDLHMLRVPEMKSCIVNLAYIDNIEDCKLLINNIDSYSHAIYKGICGYFNSENM